MRPVSAAWSRTIPGSHRAIFRATVCAAFQTGTLPTGTIVDILGGGVDIDGTAHIRSTLDMEVDGTGQWPRRAADLYAPYGNEIYVERGIQYSDDLVEYVGLGYFRIDTAEQDQPPYGPIRITGSDRMAGLVDARLTRPIQFGSTTSLGYIVTTLVAEVYPDAVIVWDDDTDDAVLTRSLICEDDRHGFLDDLVRAQGKIWYWDHAGRLAIKSPPDPTAPVADVVAGAGGILLDAGRALTRRGVYNAVVASGEAFDSFDPPMAIAIDNNALSPTYYYGRFGPTPRFFTSPFILSPGQASAAAETTLRQHLGLPYALDLTLSPDPAFEPWDPVRVRVDDREGAETHVLETLRIPLTDKAAMTATTREQTTVLIGSI